MSLPERISKLISSGFKRKIQTLQMSRFRYCVDLPIRLLFGKNLKALATLYGSDKWNAHWYARHYEAQFRPIRRNRLTLIEIGIGGYGVPHLGGGSLRMWRSYFPHAQIHGIDIEEKSPHAGRRITVHRGSQTDLDFLRDVVKKSGVPDIVIDDGSHRNRDVLCTFKFLFPLLAPGGYYVIEDTQTSYWLDGSTTERNSPRTTMGFFKSRVDGLNWEEYFGDYTPNDFDLTIESIAFYHNLIVLKKGHNREGSQNREWHQRDPNWMPAEAFHDADAPLLPAKMAGQQQGNLTAR